MLKLAICQQKGGCGKTTLAAHLAVVAELTGMRSVLLDTDPQANLGDWWTAREADTPALAAGTLDELPGKLDQLAEAGFKVAVIDTPPGVGDAVERIVGLVDFVLIPVQPSPNDLRAVGATVTLVTDAGKPFGFVVNRAASRSNLTTQTVALLSAHGVVSPALVANRSSFASSMTDGRTVLEIGGSDKGAVKGAMEIRQLWTWTKNEMQKAAKANRKKEAAV